MSSPLYWFVMWILASVPVGLCLGCLCGLNQLSLDDDAADAGPMETDAFRKAAVHPGAAFGALQPDTDMTLT